MVRIADTYGNAHYYNEQGLSHREDGPAAEYVDGEKHYYINNLLHRVDGPAIECPNGQISLL